MSYVQCIVTTKVILMSSDGRVTANEKIIDENYKKIRRLNSHILVGYAGNKDLCELVLSQLNYTEKYVEDILRHIEIICKNLETQLNKTLKGQFIVAGLCCNNKLGFKTLSTNNNFKHEYKVPQNDKEISFCAINSDTVTDVYLSNELQAMINKNNVVDTNNLIEAMKKAAISVSAIDKSVNNMFFLERINF